MMIYRGMIMKIRRLFVMALFFALLGFSSCEVATSSGGNFYAVNLSSNSYYLVDAGLLYSGSYCLIYADVNSGVSYSMARAVAKEYDQNIHNEMIESFGTIRDVDGNGKVIFLLLDIKDGFNGSTKKSYTGGYFSSNDMLNAPYSNRADMLYLDTYPTRVGSSAFFSTMAHELQHLINYSQTAPRGRSEKDAWINEGLSTAAEYLYSDGGDPNNRIADYVYDQTQSIAYGNNFFVWNGYWESAAAGARQDAVANYDTAYLFFQWLRIHASNGTAIYKDIIQNSSGDYRAVLDAARLRFIPPNPTISWADLMRSWLLSNYLYTTSSGIIGYGKDPDFIRLMNNAVNEVKRYSGSVSSPTSNKIFPGNGATCYLYPGEGVFSSNSVHNPGASGVNIGYEGIGDILLTYNGNSEKGGSRENGYLAGTPTPSLGRSAAGPEMSLENPLPEETGENPFRDGPVDWKVIAP
jgi:hypothetical protein